MNKIEHDGKTYEVLPLDRISEITHAKLAGGKVVEAEECPVRGELCCLFRKGIWFCDWNDLGIQPLRLVPKEPVTFEATCVVDSGVRGETIINAPSHCIGKRFRCVEIVEEA
jgi:hypothetical protein